MLPSFDLTINVFVLMAVAGLSALSGFALRSRQLAKKQRQIKELEKEVVMVSAEILNVQKEYCELEGRLKDMSIPVISIKQATTKDGPHDESQENKAVVL